MNKLIPVVLFLLLAISVANATVMPPPEWFEKEGNAELWQEIWPQLNEMEFGTTDPLPGPGVTTAADLRTRLGRSASNTEISEDGRSLDLNLDGVIDHFDLLELGYEVPRVTKTTSIAPSEGTAQWCVLRADFDGDEADYDTYDIDYFNEKFFDSGVTPPSANDYFQEVSYGKLEIDGAVADGGSGGDGWYRADNSKGFYDASSNNARNMIYEMVIKSDPHVDYSDFDVDGDGYVDTLIVFYAGPVIFGGGLHPHRWSGVNAHVDGVIVDSYFLTGYDDNDSYSMTITCHEYGHILGLPDLYDVDYSSNGVGRWSLMANNYDNDQLIPSPDPWCKCQLGWVEPTVITENVDDYPLNPIQTHPEILKVWTNGQQEDQYFLVANYQQIMTDQTRPGEGLMILHIDDSIGGGNSDNSNEYRKHVDVESARGFGNPGSSQPRDPIDGYQVGESWFQSSGHPNDLWFDGNDDGDYTGEFSGASNPSSNRYPAPGSGTSVRMSDFSVPQAVMTLDIEVTTANAPLVAITSHIDNDNESDDITVTATATPQGGRSIDRVEFYLNDAYFGFDDSAPYELVFFCNGVYNGSHPLRAVAVDSEGEIGSDSVDINISNTPESYPWSESFGLGISYWASYNMGGAYRWEDKNANNSPPYSAGVGSEGDGYERNEHDLLVSPLIDMTGATAPIARWYQRYRVSTGENTCKLLVTTDEGASWETLESFTGTNTDWHVVSTDMADYIGQQIRLGFRLDSSSLNNISNGTGGFWVDDVFLKETSSPPTIDSITPGDGGVLTGVETITVAASDDEGIAGVEFILDGEAYGYDDTAPYTTEWNSDLVFDSALNFTAIATDLDGQQASLTIDWTTSNPGLSLPWTEDWEGPVEPFYQIIDNNGGGWWHTRGGQGFGGSTAMFFGRNNGDYRHFQNDSLITPTILIDGVTNPGLGWVHSYDIEEGFDYAIVYVTTDLGSWTELAAFSDENVPWRADGLLLDAWLGEKVKLNWFFYSDQAVDEDGYWFDEVVIREAPAITDVSPAKLVDGQSFTITGTDFGTDDAVEFATVLVNGMVANVTSWTPTSIEATVPAGATSGDVMVLSRGIPSNGMPVTIILAAPTLTEIGSATD